MKYPKKLAFITKYFSSLFLKWTIVAIILMTLTAGPIYLVSFFTNDPEVLKHGVIILPWIGLLQFLDAFAITFWFALSGAGDTKFTAYVAVIANWAVFIPLSYLFGIVLDMGVMGPWFAFGILLLIESMLIIFRVRQGKWKHIEV